MLYASHDTLYQVWSLPASRADGPWQPADVPDLVAFRRAVADRLGRAGVAADPASVTRRVIAYYGAKTDRDSRDDADNGRRVLAGDVGVIRPLTCLEALLLDTQARRFSMAQQPTEFHTFILRRGDPDVRRADAGAAPAVADDSLLVYFAASGAPWPPSVRRLAAAVEAKTREGWRVVAHVHNHPFYLHHLHHLRPDSAGRPTADIAGGLAPSITDVQFYRAMHAGLGLVSAQVTNGFATVDLPAAAFDRLHARGDAPAP